MHRWLRCLNGFELEPYFIDLPLAHLRSGATTMRVPIILPAEVMKVVHDTGGTRWQEAMIGQRADGHCPLDVFWRNASRQPWFKLHPHLRGGFQKTIPMVWHVDGAEFRTERELLVFSWCSPLTRGNTWSTRFVFAVLPMHLVGHGDQQRRVITALVAAIAWQTDVVAAGRFGERGYLDEPLTGVRRLWAGQDIAGGWRAVWAGWQGDAKARNQVIFFCVVADFNQSLR